MSTFPRILVVCEFATTRYISSEGLTVTPDYLELQDGSGRLQLQDGSGLLVLQTSPVTEATDFENRLLNSPEIEQQIDQVLPQDISLELANADASFSMAEDYAGKTVKIYRYEILSGTMDLWFTGYVDGVELGPKATFSLKPKPDAVLDTLLPRKCLEASDWATHADGNPNGTTIIVPETDLGKPYQVPLGNFNKLELVYAYQNTVSDYYDYLCLGPVEEITTVYRNNRVVGSSEYSWNDGTNGKYVDADGRQYAYVRFTRQQKTSNGEQLEITADGKGLTMGGSTAERNFINVIKYLLEDSLDGLNQTVDTASFVDSAALSHITPLYCDGVIGRDGQQQSARNILDEMLYCCYSNLQRKNDGSWKIYTDQPVASSSLTLGACDGVAENIGEISVERLRASETPKSIQYAYRYNQWEGTYPLLTSVRTVLDVADAKPENRELNFVDDPTTADRIACYYQLLYQQCQYRATISGGMDGLSLDLLQKVTVVDKVIAGGGIVTHVDDDWLVLNYSRRQNSFEAYCRNYDTDIFTYSAGTLPDAPVSDDDPDTTYTPPGAPTDLTLESSGTEQGSDGTTYAYVVLSAIAPTSNCQYLLFGYRVAGQNFVWTKGTYSSGTGRWSAKCTGMVPGLTYEYYGAQAINPANATDYTDGTVATLAAGVAPGDTLAPANVTAGTGRVKLKTWTFPWTKVTTNSDGTAIKDLASYHVQISTVSNFASTVFDGYEGTNSKEFTYDSAAYGSALYCRVKARDFSGNESASWSSTMTATCSQAGSGDIANLSITNAHIANATITSAKIASATITDANIANATITSAKIANLDAAKITSGILTITSSMGITIQDGGDITFALATGKTVVIDCDTSLTTMKISPSTSTGSSLSIGGTTPWNIINLYAATTVLLEANVGNDITLLLGAAGGCVLGPGVTKLAAEGGADIGDSTYYWGDTYLWDEWKLTRYAATDEVLWYHGGVMHFSHAPGTALTRGAFWTGYVYYDQSLVNQAWTKDFSKYDKTEILGSLVEAYRTHDGSKMHEILQIPTKKWKPVLGDALKDGIVLENSLITVEEEVIGKSPDDILQLVVELLYEHISKEK